MNTDTLEIAAFISGIINIVMLIVFCFMAKNINVIRKILEDEKSENNLDYLMALNKGKLKEYQGKNEEALDSYTEAYYRFNKKYGTYREFNPAEEDISIAKRSFERSKEEIKSKIISLGGTVKEN